MIERNPATAWHAFGPRVVLVPLERLDAVHNNVLVLSGSGPLLWQALEKPQSLESLVSLLEEQYQVEPERARTDVLTFLEQLAAWRATVET